MAERELPQDVERGVATLEERLGGDGLLTRVAPRAEELASFDVIIPPDFLGVERTAEIGFPRDFPHSALRVVIKPSAFLDWPHVMAKSVCLFGDRNEPASGDPEEVVIRTVDQLDALIRMAMPTVPQSQRDAEFAREVRSYWAQQFGNVSAFQLVLSDIPSAAAALYALTDAQLRQGVETVVLASHIEGLQRASFRLGVRQGKIKAPAAAGFYLPLTFTPSVRLPPPERLLDWLQPACVATDHVALQAWLNTEAHPFRFLVLRLPNGVGTPAFQAFVLRSPGLIDSARPQLGRRAGRRRSAVPALGRLARIDYARLHVIAPEVVHSRAMEAPGPLRGAHVVLIGVGSLGGAMAVNLARAGVGRLTLIDPDELEADNLGRHVLGARQLGESKALALRDRLHEDVPTAMVSAIPTYVQWGGEKVRTVLADASLVLVSSADWRSELWLWERKRAGGPWALVQVWSEPHAVAGHALVSPAYSPDDPRPLFDSDGRFHQSFSEWPDDGIVTQPACGGSYIPGGPVGLAAIAAMGAQAAIDTLIGSNTEPQWYALTKDARSVESAGGTYKGPPLSKGVVSQITVGPWPLPASRAS